MQGLRAIETKRFRLSSRALACAAACAAALLAPATARAATITVNSAANAAANDGQCTLREAIIAANTNTASGGAVGECATGAAGLDTIEFAIPGAGVQTIAPAPGLPTITEAVFINGYTQPGSSTNTNAFPAALNTVLLIELNQTSAVGLTINGAGTTIRGLVLNRGVDNIAVNASNVTIAGNFIGTNPAGAAAMPAAGGGIGIRQTSGDNTLIGGSTAADRNLLSGNSQGSITVQTGNGNRIEGNYIGTDVTGTVSLNSSNSSQFGVNILGGGFPFLTTNTVISGNLISGNMGGGLQISGPGGGLIQGNLIGTQRDGIGALGNGNFGGIHLSGTGFLVGGTSPGQGNTIAFNVNNGIGVTFNNFGNGILGNSIHSNPGASNSGLGINLSGTFFVGPLPNDGCDTDSGQGNRGQNYPVISTAPIAAGNVTISGTLNSTASTTFRIELFSNVAADPSGNGEGQTFIGFANVTTDGTCNASFGPLVFAVPPGETIFSATATDPSNNTSEFSVAFPVGAPPTPTPTATPTLTPTSTPTSPGPTPTPTLTPTVTPSPGPGAGAADVPTLTPGMMALFGVALAAAGLLLLRRSS